MRRLPLLAFTQDISVANPPTLLLLVDSLLRGLPEPAGGEESAPGPEACAAEAKGDIEAPPQEGAAAAAEGSGRQKELEGFLRKAYPLLDLWMRWLLITQRPGATGWGGQAKGAPLGAFQVQQQGLCFELFRPLWCLGSRSDLWLILHTSTSPFDE